MDLMIVLTDFEEYYQMKFQKPPILTKKLAEAKVQNQLPKLKNSTPKPPKSQSQEKDKKPLEALNIAGKEIKNEPVKTEREESQEFYENRVLKALPPELSALPELKELAQFL